VTRADWGDLAGAVFVLALIYVLVRPSSIAPAFITGVGAAVRNLVTYAVSG
jgi:hypothetical protein